MQFTKILLALHGWVPDCPVRNKNTPVKVALACCQGDMLCHSAISQLNDWFNDWY